MKFSLNRYFEYILLNFTRCTSEITNLLCATRVSDFSDSGVMPTHLCTHAADVDLINANQLKALAGFFFFFF